MFLHSSTLSSRDSVSSRGSLFLAKLSGHPPLPIEEEDHEFSSASQQYRSQTVKTILECVGSALTTFDLAAMDSYVKVIRAFQPPMPSNSVMKDGLANALNHFPHLAGRFSSDAQLQPCILLNGAGVRLVETRLTTHLSDWLKHSFNLSSSPEACCLAPETAGTEELLHIQLNRFACGGMVIGVAAHHRVADGPAMSLFLAAWTRLVQGLDVGRIPCHDRSAIATHRDPPLCEFSHQDIEFRTGRLQIMSAVNASTSFVTLKVHFSSSFISILKLKMAPLMAADNNHRYHHRFTTFECLLTHVWKKITQVRGLDNKQTTRARIAVNGRRGGRTKAPAEYFGNLVLWARPEFTVKDLMNECNSASVAQTIHEALATVNERYFQSFVDFGEMERKKGSYGALSSSMAEAGGALSPDIEVDSWLGMPSTSRGLDFGGGKLCAAGPPDLPYEGLLVMAPSFVEEGSVEVFLSLHDKCVARFMGIVHSLQGIEERSML